MITEEWARTAPAGLELDRVCLKFLGYERDGDVWVPAEPGDITIPIFDTDHVCEIPDFSNDWHFTGLLLEAVQGLPATVGGAAEYYTLQIPPLGKKWTFGVIRYTHHPSTVIPITSADTGPLAVARGVGVLDAKGIERRTAK